ncbi:unnamed protein product [Brachionus calyciflorus]|uniref:EF-hand domain-containing protein n=1 Tax=Brachionus calyciflorus TaxID=104777 RepID=A0A813XBA8_9BILA|nr:unnamed protein product [Brachionus calyciflorus]
MNSESNNLKRAFKMLDIDKTGQFSMSEIKHLYKLLNLHLDPKIIEKTFDKLDSNKDGKIEFEEFLKEIEIHKDIHYEHTFQAIDLDKSGFITLDELFKVVKKLNATISRQEVENMMNKIDLDGNHKITLEEFISLMED